MNARSKTRGSRFLETAAGFIVAAVLCAGCKTIICESGETLSCFCESGDSSVRTCNADRTGWTSCACDESDASTDEIEDPTEEIEDTSEPEPECSVDEQCDDEDPCTVDACNEYGNCSNTLNDEDDDGYFAATIGATDCGGLDCDDTDESIHPDAEETSCTDDVDQDCQGPNLRIDSSLGVTTLTGVEGNIGTVVFTGSEFIVGSEQGQLARVDLSGIVAGTPATLPWYPSGLAWTGSEIGIAAYDDDVISDLVFARFDAAGAPIGSTVELTFDSDAPVGGPSTDLAWTGSEFVVLGHTASGSNHTQHFFRLDPTGVVQVSTTHDVPGSEVNALKVIWTGSETAALWTDLRAGSESIMLGRITLSGTKPVEDTRLTSLELDDLLTDAAWTGSQFAVTWQTHTGSDEFDNFQLFDRFGIALGDATNIDGMLAWTTSEFLVLEGQGDASRVSAQGEVLIRSEDPRIPDGIIEPGTYALAWTGSALGVVVFGTPFRFLTLEYCF